MPYKDLTQRYKNKERHNATWRLTYRLKKHGVTREQYDAWKAKGCAICGRIFVDTPCVDHDHSHCSGKYGCRECVRGLLCNPCNSQFIAGIERNILLRAFVSARILTYVDSKKQGGLLPRTNVRAALTGG